MYPTKIHHKLLLLVAFLAICNGLVSEPDEKRLQDTSKNPVTSFRSLLDQFKIQISQHPKFNDLSQSLNQIGLSWEKCLTKFREVDQIYNMLQRTSAFNNSLSINPTRHEENVKQKVDDLGRFLQETKILFQEFKQEIHAIPSNQLTDGAGKAFEELTNQLRHFQHEFEGCSEGHLKLLDQFEKLDQQNNAALGEIKEFDESIQLRTNYISKNNARINDLERKSQEELEQRVAKYNEKQGSYQAELANKNKAALDSSEERIKLLDEQLATLDTQAAENQDPDTIQEIQRLTDERERETRERLDLIKAIEEFNAAGAPYSLDESGKNQDSLSRLAKLEEEKNELLQENERIQREIKNLRSGKDKIRTFTATLGDLRQTLEEKKKECNKIQESIEGKKQERDGLIDDKSLEVGVLVQRDLIKGLEKIMESKQNLIELVESALNKLGTDHYGLENFLQKSNFKSLEDDIRENPDLYLPLVYGQDSCKEGVDCLQEIFVDKFAENKFETRVPLSTHLSAIFTRTESVRSMLKDENNTLPFEIQNYMRTKYLSHKKSLWSITSLAQSVVDFLLDCNPTLFVKIGEEEFNIEMIKMEAVYRAIINRVKKDYEKFAMNRWKEKLEDEISKISSSNTLTGVSLARSSE